MSSISSWQDTYYEGYQKVKGMPSRIEKIEVTKGENPSHGYTGKIILKNGTTSKEIEWKDYEIYALFELVGSKRIQGSVSMEDLKDSLFNTKNHHFLHDPHAVKMQALYVYTTAFPNYFKNETITLKFMLLNFKFTS